MRCPVCFSSQTIQPGEMIHVCPYCDAILIYDNNKLKTIDKFPWWIKKIENLSGIHGLIITEKRRLEFQFKGKWILNEKFVLVENISEKGSMDEAVKYIYGSIPVFTLPDLKLGVIEENGIKIYHQKGCSFFKPFE